MLCKHTIKRVLKELTIKDGDNRGRNRNGRILKKNNRHTNLLANSCRCAAQIKSIKSHLQMPSMLSVSLFCLLAAFNPEQVLFCLFPFFPF